MTALCVGGASQPVILDWHTGQDLAARFSECNVFAPAGGAAVLPYLDGTVDVIAIGDPTPERVAEARRVAADVVVGVNGSQSQPSVEVLWQAEPDESRSDHTSLVVSHSDGKPPPLAFLHHLEETIPSSLACEVVLPIGSGVKVAAPSERVQISSLSE